METFGIRKKEFEVTNKNIQNNDSSVKQCIRYAIPQIIFFILTAVSLSACIGKTLESGTLGYIVIIFWLMTNLYNLAMAIFFILGRKAVRGEERAAVNVPVTVSYDGVCRQTESRNISESGVAFIMPEPVCIPADRAIRLVVKNESGRYKADLVGEIVMVKSVKEGWLYSVHFLKPDDDNFLQLSQIIHDRAPQLPELVSCHSSYFEDLKRNVMRRRARTELSSNRKLPRVEINRIVKAEDGSEVLLQNFNYSYILVKDLNRMYPEKMKLHIDEADINIDCILERTFGQSSVIKSSESALYKVINYDELSKNEKIPGLLLEWQKEVYRRKKEHNRRLRQLQKINAFEFYEEDYI